LTKNLTVLQDDLERLFKKENLNNVWIRPLMKLDNSLFFVDYEEEYHDELMKDAAKQLLLCIIRSAMCFKKNRPPSTSNKTFMERLVTRYLGNSAPVRPGMPFRLVSSFQLVSVILHDESLTDDHGFLQWLLSAHKFSLRVGGQEAMGHLQRCITHSLEEKLLRQGNVLVFPTRRCTFIGCPTVGTNQTSTATIGRTVLERLAQAVMLATRVSMGLDIEEEGVIRSFRNIYGGNIEDRNLIKRLVNGAKQQRLNVQSMPTAS
jgi:hypothetical protein